MSGGDLWYGRDGIRYPVNARRATTYGWRGDGNSGGGGNGGGGGILPDWPEQDPDTVSGWNLRYSTDFQDLSGWDVKNGQTQNNDNSVNLAKNVLPGSVADSKGLTIEGYRESGYSQPFTSGEIYGTGQPNMILPNYFRLCVIGRTAKANGFWPAIMWMRPYSGGDGSNGEIDVMEYMGGRVENQSRMRIAVTMHNEYGSSQDSAKKPIYIDQLPNPDNLSLDDLLERPHKYVIEKTPGYINIWIDGVQRTFSAADKGWWNRIMEAANRTWYMRITLQIGAGSSTAVVPNPDTGWNYDVMQVASVKTWDMS